MRFSIMITVFNAAEYLTACVDSVLAQDFNDYEVILVDDGSTDLSGQICDRYAEQDRRIRVYHTENRGVFLARQFAEECAKGEYLLHFDSDDLVEPELLQTLSEKIDRFAPDLLVYDFSTFQGDAAPVRESFWESDRLIVDEALEDMYRLVFSTRFNTLCNKCFHRKFITCAPDYDSFSGIRHGEDLLRSAYIVFAAERAYYIHRSFYNYRIGIGQTQHFDPGSLRLYDRVDRTLMTILKGIVDVDEVWEGVVYDLCRKQLDNYLRLLAGSDVSLLEGVSLLRKASVTDLFRCALSVAPNDLKYTLLRRRSYMLLLLLHRGKRWLRA